MDTDFVRMSCAQSMTSTDTARFGTYRQATEMDEETRKWAMFLHLSILAGYMVPFAGLIAPILIWQLKKDQMPALEHHGKEAVNFMISVFIYGVVCVLLWFVLIGFILSLALAVAAVVFPIIAGLKSSNGEMYRYPYIIRLI